MNLERILPPGEKSDMALTAAIPFIVRTNDVITARQILGELPLWYSEKTNAYSQVFWTENHYLMCTSCDYVLRRFLGEEIPATLTKRLHALLDLKLEVGMAEFLSPVYYPFTIASLLNLFDYSGCDVLRQKTDGILNEIAHQLLCFTQSDGSMVSPSGRSYARHRNTSTGQHIHQFIDFVCSGAVKGTPDQALYSTLITTTWKPKHFPLPRYETNLVLTPDPNHLIRVLDRLVGRGLEDLDTYVSILWSYGMYVPPTHALRSMVVSFMDNHGLWDHPHFQSIQKIRRWLCFSPAFWIGLVSDLFFSPYVRGLWLVGAKATIYREGRVMLSSLTGYNEGLPSFQQWPWVVNLDGVVLWCGFGDATKSSLFGNTEAESSSARLLPTVIHESNRLVADYRAQHIFVRWSASSSRPIMRWPTELLEETMTTKEQWVLGRKNNAAVAFRVQSLTVEVIVRDLQVAELSWEAFRQSLPP